MNKQNLIIFTTGLAIFSMFFGAGNVVFPLEIGTNAGELISFAMIGLLVTTIGAPLLGLYSCILFQGDCRAYLSRIGTVPSIIIIFMILALIGPFGAMPRCITLSYAALHSYFPHIGLNLFSIISGVIILLCIAKREYILDLLGSVLSPILVITLLIIIVKGLLADSPMAMSQIATPMDALTEGLVTGYNTMDLLGAIMFSVSIWQLLKEKLKLTGARDSFEVLMPVCMKASLIGGGMLAVIYIGMGLVAAKHVELLQTTPVERLLPVLAMHILGPTIAIIANIAIALACLTTVISLAVTVAEVIEQEMTGYAIYQHQDWHYPVLIFAIVALTTLFSMLGFTNIGKWLGPMMYAIYPSLIVLGLCNILQKRTGFKWVKAPFYLTLLMTLWVQYS